MVRRNHVPEDDENAKLEAAEEAKLGEQASSEQPARDESVKNPSDPDIPGALGPKDGEDEGETVTRPTVANAKGEMTIIDPTAYRAREFARVQAEARQSKSKETIPGGKFIVDGVLVNANGQRINEKGKVLD